jgi:hypothetical protein
MKLNYGIQSSSEKTRKKDTSAISKDNSDYLDKVWIYPGDSFFCYKLDYSEDVVLRFFYHGFKKTKEMRIFQRWFMFGEKKQT